MWIKALDSHGYGKVQFRGKTRKAHRVIAYLVEQRELEGSWETRHFCHIRACVNPEHTKKGTSKENKQDTQNRFFCRNGHDLSDPKNAISYFFKKEQRWIKQCLVCHKSGQNAVEERRKLQRKLAI